MPVGHVDMQHANAGGIIRKCRFRMGDERERTKESEAERRQTQLVFCRALRARPRLRREAHIYRRSTTVLAPRSVSSQGAQPQARLPGTWPLVLSGCYPPLPVP